MKSAKNLVIPFAILILLGIGVLVFFVIDRSMKEPEGTSQRNNVDLLYLSLVDVSSVSVSASGKESTSEGPRSVRPCPQATITINMGINTQNPFLIVSFASKKHTKVHNN